MTLWFALLESSHLALERFGVPCELGYVAILSASVFASSVGRRAADLDWLESQAVGLVIPPASSRVVLKVGAHTFVPGVIVAKVRGPQSNVENLPRMLLPHPTIPHPTHWPNGTRSQVSISQRNVHTPPVLRHLSRLGFVLFLRLRLFLGHGELSQRGLTLSKVCSVRFAGANSF